MAQNIKGIQQWIGDLKTIISKLNTSRKTETDAVAMALTKAEADVKKLKALAEKKKDKWFKSATYKDKIKTYLKVLDGIGDELKKNLEEIKKSQTSNFSDAWIEKNFKISVDMTVKDIKGRASMDLNTQLTNYHKDKANIDNYVRKWWDDYKSIPGQMATMKKWSEEADKMEEVK